MNHSPGGFGTSLPSPHNNQHRQQQQQQQQQRRGEEDDAARTILTLEDAEPDLDAFLATHGVGAAPANAGGVAHLPHHHHHHHDQDDSEDEEEEEEEEEDDDDSENINPPPVGGADNHHHHHHQQLQQQLQHHLQQHHLHPHHPSINANAAADGHHGEEEEPHPPPPSPAQLQKQRQQQVQQQQEEWNRRYQQLKEFYQQHGHTNVKAPHQFDDDVNDTTQLAADGQDTEEVTFPPGLDVWADQQRLAYRNADQDMSLERMDLLQAIKFEWNPNNYHHHGSSNFHDNMNQQHPSIHLNELDGHAFGAHNNNSSNSTNISNPTIAVNTKDTVWDPVNHRYHKAWFKRFTYLQDYVRTNHGILPKNGRAGLGRWVARQVHKYANGDLCREQIALLESVGVSWQLPRPRTKTTQLAPGHVAKFQAKVDELKAYFDREGHFDPPQGKKSPYQKLADFVKYQRYCYRHNILCQERLDSLNAIGFTWHAPGNKGGTTIVATNSVSFDERLAQLQVYLNMHGGQFPTSAKSKKNKKGSGDDALQTWLEQQRQLYLDQKLRVEHIQALEKLGFQWAEKTNENEAISGGKEGEDETAGATTAVAAASVPIDDNAAGAQQREGNTATEGLSGIKKRRGKTNEKDSPAITFTSHEKLRGDLSREQNKLQAERVKLQNLQSQSTQPTSSNIDDLLDELGRDDFDRDDLLVFIHQDRRRHAIELQRIQLQHQEEKVAWCQTQLLQGVQLLEFQKLAAQQKEEERKRKGRSSAKPDTCKSSPKRTKSKLSPGKGKIQKGKRKRGDDDGDTDGDMEVFFDANEEEEKRIQARQKFPKRQSSKAAAANASPLRRKRGRPPKKKVAAEAATATEASPSKDPPAAATTGIKDGEDESNVAEQI